MPILPSVLNDFTTTDCDDFAYAYLAEDNMTSFTDITRTSEAQAPSDRRSTQSKLGNSTTPLLEKFYRGTTTPFRILPDFLIIGTQRGGTTSLYHYLQAHPSIRLANTKDTHFFDKKYSNGLVWYRAH